MNTYICKSCKKPQYSASSEKANEPCVYCGGAVELADGSGGTPSPAAPQETAVVGLNALARDIHENAVLHGWWKTEREFGTIIALCHSELSEALEEYRGGRPNLWYVVESEETLYGDGIEVEKITKRKPEGVAVELADCIIRILDYCGRAGIDIEEAIRIKHEYNKTRPYRHGGKKC